LIRIGIFALFLQMSNWEVVGGVETGGILVREGKDLKSTQCSERLSTGALLKQVALEGDRLNFELLEGSGPAMGWVSVKIKEKTLLVKTSRTLSGAGADDLLADPADAGADAGGDAGGVDEALRSAVMQQAAKAKKDDAINTWCMKHKILGYPLAGVKFRIFCFHSAGSAESMWTGPAMNPFLTWAKETKAVEVIAASYPGRDKTRDRKPHETTRALTEDMLPVFFDKLNDGVPFAFWAHSVGTWVAFELLMLMRKVGLPMPTVCYFNAFPAPHFPTAARPWRVNRSISDKQMKDELMNWDKGHFGGRGKVVYDEPDWSSTYLPMMRADFRLFDEYTFAHAGAAKFDFPIFSTHFEQEHFTKGEWVQMWKDWTTGGFTYDQQDAGHLTCVYDPPKKKKYFTRAAEIFKQFAGC